MARRHPRLLTDAQWERIEPLLPQMPAGEQGGRPWCENRRVMEGILWILKTGARWRDLPEEYPSPSTCWRRLRRWQEEDVWLQLWRAYLAELDERGQLDWEESFADATFVSAKKGALPSGRRSAAKEQSFWWWSTARVFLWEASSLRRPRRKSRSSKTR